MHSQFQVGDTIVMASDGQFRKYIFRASCCRSRRTPKAEADKIFNGLAEGGQVHVAPRFGIVADKFGVGWMVIVPQ